MTRKKVAERHFACADGFGLNEQNKEVIMARPAALGMEFTVTSLDDADLVLAELAYLQREVDGLGNEAKSRIDAVKSDILGRSVVTVSGQAVPISERIELLASTLEAWIAGGGLAPHLVEGGKSIKLPHGTLGMRQQPQSIDFVEGDNEKTSIEKLNEVSKGLIGKIFITVAKLVKGFGLMSSYVTVKMTLNKTGIKKAYEQHEVKAEKLASIGLVVREPFDAPFIETTKVVTSIDIR